MDRIFWVEGWVQSPIFQSRDLQSPNVQSPTLQLFRVQVSRVQASRAKCPASKCPKSKRPGFQASRVQASRRPESKRPVVQSCHSNLGIPANKIKCFPIYYEQIIKRWSENLSSLPNLLLPIAFQVIWHGKCIKVDNKTIYNFKMPRQDINYVGQLFKK